MLDNSIPLCLTQQQPLTHEPEYVLVQIPGGLFLMQALATSPQGVVTFTSRIWLASQSKGG